MNDDALRTWLDDRTRQHEFSGSVLIWRDGGPVFTYHGGLAHRGHGVPVTERTRSMVASVTKMVTAVAALRLVERGVLRLHQPLLEVLPERQRPIALTPEHTLHHLLSHTSGLANYYDDDDTTWESFTSSWDRIPMYRIRRPADMLPLFVDLPAVRPPGTKFQYVDTNFILAGLVIEAASGLPYPEAVAAEVFGPAGMTRSDLGALDDDPADLATGYLVTDGPPAAWRTNTFSLTVAGMPDGGMISSPTDLARFMDALLGGRLLGPEMLTAMTAPQGPPSDEIEQYGYGLDVVVVDGAVTIVGHGGGDPGISAMVSHYREAATTVIVLCNQDRGALAAARQIAVELGLADPRD
jgi:CubicO group peptidase (beta-lactamase class C family)